MRDLGIKNPQRVAKVGDTPSDLQQGAARLRTRRRRHRRLAHRAELEPFPHTHLVGTIAEVPALLGT